MSSLDDPDFFADEDDDTTREDVEFDDIGEDDTAVDHVPDDISNDYDEDDDDIELDEDDCEGFDAIEWQGDRPIFDKNQIVSLDALVPGKIIAVADYFRSGTTEVIVMEKPEHTGRGSDDWSVVVYNLASNLRYILYLAEESVIAYESGDWNCHHHLIDTGKTHPGSLSDLKRWG